MMLKLLNFLALISVASAINFPCERKQTTRRIGNYRATKMDKNSKFVFIDRRPSGDFSFSDAAKECQVLGLELGEIKHYSDIIVLEHFFGSRQDVFYKNTTRFWHSAVSKVNGQWTYANENHDPLVTNSFWCMTSFHIPTKIPPSEASNYGMLQWFEDDLRSLPFLAMIDAEPLDNSFKQKSFICQFPKNSDCSSRSNEERKFKQSQSEVTTLAPISDAEIFFISNKQLPNAEGRKLCEKNRLAILELHKNALDGLSMFKNTGAPVASGFWVGANDVFHPLQNLTWNWLEENYVRGYPTNVFGVDLPTTRLGWHSYTGNCLAVTSFGNDKNEWYLQPVSCHLPQYVICHDPVHFGKQANKSSDTLVQNDAINKAIPEKRGRGANSYPEKNFTINCDRYTDQKWRVYPGEDCYRQFRCFCQNGAWALEMFPCPQNSYADPTKVPSVCHQGRNKYIGKPECDWPERFPGRINLLCGLKAKGRQIAQFNCPQVGNFQHPECTKYFKCILVKGKMTKYLLTCPRGNYFSAKTGLCEFGNCPKPTTTTTTTKKPTPKLTTTTTTRPTTTTMTTTTPLPTTTTRPTTTTTTTTTTHPTTTSSTTEKSTTTTTTKPTTTTTTTTLATTTTTKIPTTPTIPTTIVYTAVTTICTTIEMTTTEVSTISTTPLPTTQIPYRALECSKRQLIDEQFGDVHIKRMGRASKFVHLDYNSRGNDSYEATKSECEKWGLELVEIKSKVDVETIQSFFHTHMDGSAITELVYWISGSDELHNGDWKYSTNAQQRLMYQNFWGFSPLYISATFQTNEPSHLILRWKTEEDPTKNLLVMLDVGGDDQFYEKGGVICQFPASSIECNHGSREELELQCLQQMKEQPDEIGFLKGQALHLFSNKVQKTKIEAEEFCTAHNMSLIDIRNLDPTDAADLFTNFYEFAGKFSAFWVGTNDLFHETTPLPWDWATNQMLQPWADKVLMAGDRVRDGRPRSFGKRCLVLGVVGGKDTKFLLQYSPCELPQYAVCTEE